MTVAWWIGETLRAALLRALASKPSDRTDALSRVVERVGKTTRCAPLLKLVSDRRTITTWVAEMPEVHRVEWLMQRVALDAAIEWAERPAVPSGPIELPRAERDRIVRRLERLWSHCISKWDDDPDADEYIEALEAELDRVSRKHEALALRLLTKRFPDRTGALTLPFHELLLREGSRLTSARVLELIERRLEVTWAGPAPKKARSYSPKEKYRQGEVIEHFEFGIGTVIETLSDHVRVQFADRVRALLSAKA